MQFYRVFSLWSALSFRSSLWSLTCLVWRNIQKHAIKWKHLEDIWKKSKKVWLSETYFSYVIYDQRCNLKCYFNPKKCKVYYLYVKLSVLVPLKHAIYITHTFCVWIIFIVIVSSNIKPPRKMHVIIESFWNCK